MNKIGASTKRRPAKRKNLSRKKKRKNSLTKKQILRIKKTKRKLLRKPLLRNKQKIGKQRKSMEKL